MLRKISFLVLLFALFAVPVYAEDTDVIRIPYNAALRAAQNNLPAITRFDELIENMQDTREDLRRLYAVLVRLEETTQEELDEIDQQIAELSANIQLMGINKEMSRISTELTMRNALTSIANTELDIRLSEARLEQDRTNLHVAELRFEAGLISETALREAELDLQQNEANLYALNTTLVGDRQNLNRIIQRTLTGNYYIVYERELTDLPANLNNFINQRVNRQPTVRIADINLSRARVALRQFETAFGSTERAVRERAVTQAERERAEAIHNIEAAMRSQYNTLTTILRSNESLEIDLQRATERRDSVIISYEAGFATAFDVAAAELAILAAEIGIERNLNNFWNLQFLFVNPFLVS